MADVLIDLLIVELRKEDLMEKRKSTAYDPQKCKNLENFRKFITELGIPSYNFWIGETSKQLKWRTFTGPEKLKVFKHINIQQLLPTSPESRIIKIQVLWTELLELNTMFSKGPEAITDADINDFETRSREWVDKFIHEYQTKNVTPYIHAMSNHVGEFMRVHGSILPFTQQGLEKFNDVMTKHYFRATSHQNEKALLQLIQKHNRLEHLRDEDAQLCKHHDVHCSNCGSTGHNKLSCTKPCKHCNHHLFCSHLIVLADGQHVPQCIQENS